MMEQTDRRGWTQTDSADYCNVLKQSGNIGRGVDIVLHCVIVAGKYDTLNPLPPNSESIRAAHFVYRYWWGRVDD
jgi:hypothetical protein